MIPTAAQLKELYLAKQYSSTYEFLLTKIHQQINADNSHWVWFKVPESYVGHGNDEVQNLHKLYTKDGSSYVNLNEDLTTLIDQLRKDDLKI